PRRQPAVPAQRRVLPARPGQPEPPSHVSHAKSANPEPAPQQPGSGNPANWPVFIAACRRSIDSGIRPGAKEQIMRVDGRASPGEVVIVGAGQAGLAVSYYLRAFGVEHVVLERGRVGESWRSARWDSFTLVTPNWMNRLPGYRLAAATARDFLARDTVVSLLDGFARRLP